MKNVQNIELISRIQHKSVQSYRCDQNVGNILSVGLRIYWSYPQLRAKPLQKEREGDIKLHADVRLKSWRSQENGFPYYCYYSHILSDAEWRL